MLYTLIGCTILSACGGGDGASPTATTAPAIQAAASMAPIDAQGSMAQSAALVQPLPDGFDVAMDQAAHVPEAPAPDAIATELLAATESSAGPELLAGSQTSTSALVLPPRQTINIPASTGTITTVGIENTGLVQVQVPVTFGHVFAAGDVPAGYTVTARLPDGSSLPLQVDMKARHADGSLRHAVLSAIVPRLGLLQTQQITLLAELASSAAAPAAVKPLALLDSGFGAAVSVALNGQTYSFSPAAALRSGAYTTWLSGSVVQEWVVDAPLVSAAGVTHPHLTARMSVRWYPGLSKKARIEVVVENNKTFAAAPRNFTYDVSVNVAGVSAYRQTALTHFHHARWRKLFWWDELAKPALHIRHNTAYIIASKAVPNYDQSITVSPVLLASYATTNALKNIGLMKVGPVTNYMPTSGGRPDIGPLPAWTVSYLLSMDKRAKDIMLAAADGAGTWSVHYRDEKTGFPLRLDNAVNRMITTHGNLASRGPLPVPRCANNDGNLCKSPFTPDAAHQPSLTYVPYIVTGDHFYLEEMQFWATANVLGTDPAMRNHELGLVRFNQMRGQAWSLRTLGQVAYITPDAHSQKAYWIKQLNNNLDFYNTVFVVANPNELGAYDSSGGKVFKSPNGSPWQDDFLTWSFGYINELGFAKAKPILDWKARFPVGRMTAPGFCSVEGSSYFLTMRPSENAPIFKTFAEVYKKHFQELGNLVDENGRIMKHPKGVDYFSLACGSQEQADWRTVAGGYTWKKGRMVGFADSTRGYPANMQPALAVAVATNIPNSQLAWQKFMARAVKPDYSTSAEWAIIPR